MGHTPFGYRIENGVAVIDKAAATQIKALFSGYLGGLSLENAAKEAGIKAYHKTVMNILGNKHYLGDTFYPPIIDSKIFYAAHEERRRRAAKLGRNNLYKEPQTLKIPISFTMKTATKYHSNPQKQAEYLYSLIESVVL